MDCNLEKIAKEKVKNQISRLTARRAKGGSHMKGAGIVGNFELNTKRRLFLDP